MSTNLRTQDDEFRDFIVDDEPGAGDGAAAPRRPRARKGAGLSHVSNAALQVQLGFRV